MPHGQVEAIHNSVGIIITIIGVQPTTIKIPPNNIRFVLIIPPGSTIALGVPVRLNKNQKQQYEMKFRGHTI